MNDIGKKRTYCIDDFAALVYHRVKSKEVGKTVLGPCLKAVDQESDDDTNYKWYAWNGPKCYQKELEKLESRGRIKIIQTSVSLR